MSTWTTTSPSTPRATVDVNAAVDASPADEPAAAAPPTRSRLAVAMLVGCGLLLIAAMVLGVLGFVAQSDASGQRHQTATATAGRRLQAALERSLDASRSHLDAQMAALPDKYVAISTAESDLVDAHNNYIDIANRAVTLYDGGDTAGAAALLQGDGVTALADVNAKRTAEQQAMQAAEDALNKVQEGL